MTAPTAVRWRNLTCFAGGAATGGAAGVALGSQWAALASMGALALALGVLWLALRQVEAERNRLEWLALDPEAVAQIKRTLDGAVPSAARGARR